MTLKLKNSPKHSGSNFNRMNGPSCPRCLPDQWLAVCKGGVQYILQQLGDKYRNKCFVVLVINVSIVTSTDSNHKIGFRFFLMPFLFQKKFTVFNLIFKSAGFDDWPSHIWNPPVYSILVQFSSNWSHFIRKW